MDGLVRADGGTVSGSFIYDADTNTYSAINITTTQGSSSLSGETYSGFDPTTSDASGVIFERTQRSISDAAALTGQNSLLFAFVPALTNAGGTVTPVVATEVNCDDASCGSSSTPVVLTGDIVGTPVPPPTTVQVLVTVTGLEPGPTPGLAEYSVILQNNGTDTITARADSTLSFATALAPNDPYNVTILFQPDFQTCTVSNGSGTVPANPTANITDPLVTCAPSAAPAATPVPALPLPALGLLTAVVVGFGLRRLRRG